MFHAESTSKRTKAKRREQHGGRHEEVEELLLRLPEEVCREKSGEERSIGSIALHHRERHTAGAIPS